MIGRTVSSTEELLQLLEKVTKDWKRTADTAALLTALEGNYYFDKDNNPVNLLLTAGTQLMLAETKSDRDSLCKAMKKCLKLVEALTENENTDINRLITLLRQYTATSKRTLGSCIGEYDTTHSQSALMSKYLDILFLISVRQDVHPEELRKLLSHHDEHGQEDNNFIDGSLVFDLAAVAKQDFNQSHLLHNHLLNLLRMADQGIIDADTIYHALRTPKGCAQNIGVLIANIYNTPDCYMVLARLLRHLRRHGFHINTFLPSLSDFKNLSKEDFLRYLKSVTDSNQIQEGIYLADPQDAAGKIMYQARGLFPCDLESGTLNAVASVVGMRVIRNALQANELAEEARIAVATNISIPSLVRPSAPPMTEKNSYKESTALFAKEPPAEYMHAPVNQTTTDVDILSARLRMAAAYKKNDTIADLVKRGAALDYNRDVGDICADAPPLYHAAEQNNLDGVNILLDLGANVNCQRRNRMTALSIATHFNHENVIRTLLDRGADVDIITREGNSPLFVAATHCSSDILDIMVEKLCAKYAGNPQGLKNFLERNDHYNKCLENSISGNHLLSLLKLKDFMLAEGLSKEEVYALMPTSYTFKLSIIKDEYMEALSKQSHAKQRDICNKIVNDPESWEYKLARFKNGVFLDPRSGHGMIGKAEAKLKDYREQDNQFCLEVATLGQEFKEKLVSKERSEAIKQAIIKRIESGVNINAVKDTNGKRTWDGNTPLCCAASFGNFEFIMMMLNLGADINQKNIFSRKTLLAAINRKAMNDDKIPVIQKFLDTHEGEVFEFLPEEFAALFEEHDAANFLKIKRLEKNGLAQLEAAIAHAAAPAPFLAYVPPQPFAIAPPPVAAEIAPPTYADAIQHPKVKYNADGTTTLVYPNAIPAQAVAEATPVKEDVDLNHELWVAAGSGKHEVLKVKNLLDAGAEINNLHNGRSSALFAAAEANDTAVIKYLLERGADPTQSYKMKRSLIDLSVVTRSAERQQRWKEYMSQQTDEFVELLPETIAELNGNLENADMLRKAREALAAKAAANESAFALPPVPAGNAYPVAPAEKVVDYPEELQKLLEIGAKGREQAEALRAKLVVESNPEPVAHVAEKKELAAEPVCQDLISFTDDAIVAQPVVAVPVISAVALEEAFLDVYGPHKPVDNSLLSLHSMFTPEVTAPVAVAPAPAPSEEAVVSSTASIHGNLISFGEDEPVKKPYHNPFDEVVVETKPVAARAYRNPFEIPADVTEADLKTELENNVQYAELDDAEVRKLFGLPAAESKNPFEEAQIAEAQKVFESLPSLPEKRKPAAIFFPPAKAAEPAPAKQPVAKAKQKEKIAVMTGNGGPN